MIDTDIPALNEADTPLSAQEWAERLRKWADVLEIPSGPFVNDDLRGAADFLSRLSVSPLPEEIAELVEHLKHVADSQDRIYPYLENKPRKAAAALERMAQVDRERYEAAFNEGYDEAKESYSARIRDLEAERDAIQHNYNMLVEDTSE